MSTQTSEVWALTHYLAQTNWLCSPRLLWDYVFPRFGGSDWYTWFHHRYCRPPRERVLSLACGDAGAERHFLSIGAWIECIGYDLSPVALEGGRAAAARDGIGGLTLAIGDANSINPGEDQYDLVFGWMAWHHFENLERIYEETSRALRPGGLLLLNEYIGPPRFARTAAQSGVMEYWLSELPTELKRDLAGHIRTSCTPDPALVAAGDPSEAIRSDEIVPLLRERFIIRDQIDYGGGLLHHLLSGSMQCFDFDQPRHCEWLRILYAAEQDAMKNGVIGNDFTFIVAEPKP